MLDHRQENGRYMQVVWNLRKVQAEDNLGNYDYPYVLELIAGGGRESILIEDAGSDAYNPWLIGGVDSNGEWIEGRLIPKPEDEQSEGVTARGCFQAMKDEAGIPIDEYEWKNENVMDLTVRKTHDSGDKPTTSYAMVYEEPYLYLLNYGFPNSTLTQPYNNQMENATRGWHLKINIPEETFTAGKITFFTRMSICNSGNNPDGSPLFREQYPDDLYCHNYDGIFINTIKDSVFQGNRMYYLHHKRQKNKLCFVDSPEKYRSMIHVESPFLYSSSVNISSLAFYRDSLLICNQYSNRIMRKKITPVEFKLADESKDLKNN